MTGRPTHLSHQFQGVMHAGCIVWKQFIISHPTIKIINAVIAISFVLLATNTVDKEILNNHNNVYSQVQKQQPAPPLLSPSSFLSENKVTIHLNSVRFAPLTDTASNQLKVIAEYQTNEPTLVNTPLTGTMKVYGPDGTLVKSSSIQKGYVLGQAGIIQFATSFTDNSLQNIKAEIYLTDSSNTEKISNILKVDTSVTS